MGTFISFCLECCRHFLTGLLTCLLSPLQSLLCTTAKSIFLKHGSSLSSPCSEPPYVPFVSRSKSNVSVAPFPVTLCAILLDLPCILVNVSSRWSPEYTFILAHILLFIWASTDLITVNFKRSSFESPKVT